MLSTTLARLLPNVAGLYRLVLLLACLSSVWAQPLEARQAPNQVAINDPTDQTASFNLTAFVLPIPLKEAYSLASPYDLILDHGLPTSVVPEGQFPLLIVGGYFFDIRQRLLAGLVPLQVPQLSSMLVYLPFVDVLGGGQRAFKANARTYFDQLLPTLVGDVTQFVKGEVAIFDPTHAAYKESGAGTLSFAVSQGISNPIDGPGVVNPIFQAIFSRTSSSPLSEDQFHSMLNQPFYTTAGLGCNTETLYFNYTDANPSFVSGDVQTFTPLVQANREYSNAHGYTAAA